jgi:hypothetical protein
LQLKYFETILAELKQKFSILKNERTMKTGRRSAVFVIPNHIVGHELVFKHYTNKVVVGKYISINTIKASEQLTTRKRKISG